jgi:geranylgeranyl pyrophosphate synthase
MPGGLKPVLEADRNLVDAELRRALKLNREVPLGLAAAMRYAVLGPGKRIRPVLALEAYRAVGGRSLAVVLPFCAGIEFIHTFSLIHDDLPSMDNDDFRRGRPSLHRQFDEATAILAADGLFACAFELFAQAPGPAEPRLAAIGEICRAVGPAGMTGGQALDVAAEVRSQKAEGRRQKAGTMEHPGRKTGGRGPRTEVLEIQRKKTAVFIAAAVVAGAILGGAGAATAGKMRKAGLALGMLFQLTDDLLDAEQASEAGKVTMVSTLGREKTVGRARSEARRAERLFLALGPKGRVLAEFVEFVLNRAS